MLVDVEPEIDSMAPFVELWEETYGCFQNLVLVVLGERVRGLEIRI